MRSCFIHIGTHKTGTTSIQHLLSENSKILANRGWHYPRTGRLESHPGHHNIAWEISRDRRFDVRAGTIDDLLHEVNSTRSSVILSSEDLECALYRMDEFANFIDRLQSSGFEIVFILYVRRQADYLPRLYTTLVYLGLDATFDQFLEEVLDRAVFRWREWIFGFDYVELLRSLEALPSVKVIVRSYDRVPNSVCSDFLSIFGLGLIDLGLDKEAVTNFSLPAKTYLWHFIHNRSGRKTPATVWEALCLVFADKVATRMSPAQAERVDHKFADSNRKLAVTYGVSDFGTVRPVIPVGQDGFAGPYVDEIFSAVTETRLRKLIRQAEEHDVRLATAKTDPHRLDGDIEDRDRKIREVQDRLVERQALLIELCDELEAIKRTLS